MHPYNFAQNINIYRIGFLSLIFLFTCSSTFGISVETNKASATYQVGEAMNFLVT